jgi:hypothetical protein
MPETDGIKTVYHQCLEGGGEMGELIRSIDWSKTPIGDPSTWPSALRTSVSLMLNSYFPMYIAWGEGYTQHQAPAGHGDKHKGNLCRDMAHYRVDV